MNFGFFSFYFFGVERDLAANLNKTKLKKGLKFYMRRLCTLSFKCLTLSVFITAKQYSKGHLVLKDKMLQNLFEFCCRERRTTAQTNKLHCSIYLLLLTETDKFSGFLLSEMNNVSSFAAMKRTNCAFCQ